MILYIKTQQLSMYLCFESSEYFRDTKNVPVITCGPMPDSFNFFIFSFVYGDHIVVILTLKTV